MQNGILPRFCDGDPGIKSRRLVDLQQQAYLCTPIVRDDRLACSLSRSPVFDEIWNLLSRTYSIFKVTVKALFYFKFDLLCSPWPIPNFLNIWHP